VPGVGNVVAINLISEMPELGYITNKEISSLVGGHHLIGKVARIKANV